MITTTTTTTTANPAAGTNRVVSFPYRFDEEEHLHVYRVTSAGARTTLTEGVHYSVAGTGDSGGGSLTIFTVTTGDTIVVSREVDITQQQDYVTNDRFPAAGTEGQLDKQIMIDQQLNNGLGRAIKVLPGEPNPVVSAQADREETIMVWDTDGNYTEDTPAQLWARLPVPTATISGVGMKTWPDDAARANATYAPDFVGQLGSQIDEPDVIFRAESVAANGWVRVAGVPGATIHITRDSNRPNLDGTGTPSAPLNALDTDSLRTILENNTLVPAGSKVYIGPGTYVLNGNWENTGDITVHPGVDLLKSIAIQGAGVGKTIVKFADQRPSHPTGTVRNYRLFCFDNTYPFSGDSQVEISDMTLDANFQNHVEDGVNQGSPHTGNTSISQGAILSYAKRTIMRDLDVINCGEFENNTEGFYVAVGNHAAANGREGWAEFTRIHFHSETPKVGVFVPTENAAPFLLGSGSGNFARVSGKFADCRIERTAEGVGYGMAIVGDVEIINCSHKLVGAGASANNPLLQDTSQETSRSITVLGGYFEYSQKAYAAQFTADCELVTIKDAVFKTTHDQGSDQAMFLFNNGKRIVDGITCRGTALFASPVAWPQTIPLATDIFVTNCTFENDTLFNNVGRYVRHASNNKLIEGGDLGGNIEGNSVELGITLTAPSWRAYGARTFADSWEPGGFHNVPELVVRNSIPYACKAVNGGQPETEPGLGTGGGVFDDGWTKYWTLKKWSDLANAKQLTANYNVISTAAAYSVAVMPPAQKGVTVTVVNNGANSVHLAPYWVTGTFSAAPDDLGNGPHEALELTAGTTMKFIGMGGEPIHLNWANTSRTYAINETVAYNGVGYICTISHASTGLGNDANRPDLDPNSYWDVLPTANIHWYRIL